MAARSISFNAQIHNQRSALLLAPTPSVGSGNSVFITWASHGDQGKYHGWVMAYDAANIAQQNGVWMTTPNGTDGGVWMSGGGISSDNAGNIFMASGNGTFDVNTGGSDYGDSAFRLTLGSSGITPADYFTPGNQSTLNGSDLDMGTGAVTLLPTQSGPIPHLAVTVDKSRHHLSHQSRPHGWLHHAGQQLRAKFQRRHRQNSQQLRLLQQSSLCRLRQRTAPGLVLQSANRSLLHHASIQIQQNL